MRTFSTSSAAASAALGLKWISATKGVVYPCAFSSLRISPRLRASRSPWAVKRTYSAPASIMRMAWRTAASVSMVETFAMDWMRIGFSPPSGVFPMLTTDDLRRL